MHEQGKKLLSMEKSNKGFADHVNYKETQKKEADVNQRKRDQRQREGRHQVRK